jgi:hypothetical protein
MDSVQTTLRKLRILQLLVILLVAASGILALFWNKSASTWSMADSWILLIALFCLAEGFYLRRRFVSPATAALTANPSNAQILKRWEAWQVVTLALAGAIALYGFVIRVVLRGTIQQSLGFYIAGIILLLMWSPRTPAG